MEPQVSPYDVIRPRLEDAIRQLLVQITEKLIQLTFAQLDRGWDALMRLIAPFLAVLERV